jgi:hypothetical protein
LTLVFFEPLPSRFDFFVCVLPLKVRQHVTAMR